jgi:hypothetical protein
VAGCVGSLCGDASSSLAVPFSSGGFCVVSLAFGVDRSVSFPFASDLLGVFGSV